MCENKISKYQNRENPQNNSRNLSEIHQEFESRRKSDSSINGFLCGKNLYSKNFRNDS